MNINDKDLKNLRKKIDEVDKELLTLLDKRIDTAKQIGQLKKTLGLDLRDEERWGEVLRSKLTIAKELGLSQDFIKKLYALIHEYTLEIEGAIYEKS